MLKPSSTLRIAGAAVLGIALATTTASTASAAATPVEPLLQAVPGLSEGADSAEQALQLGTAALRPLTGGHARQSQAPSGGQAADEPVRLGQDNEISYGPQQRPRQQQSQSGERAEEAGGTTEQPHILPAYDGQAPGSPQQQGLPTEGNMRNNSLPLPTDTAARVLDATGVLGR